MPSSYREVHLRLWQEPLGRESSWKCLSSELETGTASLLLSMAGLGIARGMGEHDTICSVCYKK